MSTNCLVTKLKGSVDNSNLKKLGVLSFSVNSVNSDPKLIIDAIEGQTCRVRGVNGAKIYVDASRQNARDYVDIGHNQVAPNYTILYLPIGDATFEIDNKYSLRALTFEGMNHSNTGYEIDLSEIEYCTSIETLGINFRDNIGSNKIENFARFTELHSLNASQSYLEGDIEALANNTDLISLTINHCPMLIGSLVSLSETHIESLNITDTGITGVGPMPYLKTLYCENPNLVGNISDFLTATALPEAIRLYLDRSGIVGTLDDISLPKCTILSLNSCDNRITGNLSSMARMTQLTEIHFGQDTGVTGSIEDYAQALIDNGVTSGTYRIQTNASGITYNGAAATNILYCDITITGSTYSVAVTPLG